MFKNLANAKLGLFIFLGSTLLVVLIFLLGNKDQLLHPHLLLRRTFRIQVDYVMELL